VWLYIRRPDVYRWARTSFLVINLIGVGCFAVYPVAPPRLLAGAGVLDTVSAGRSWGSWGSPFVTHANQLAAVPSLHVAWALWVSVVLASVSSMWWVQLASAAHVTVTVIVIMATANHFLLDAVAGALVVWLGTAPFARSRRRRTTRTSGPRVVARDAFFLGVESTGAPQHVGGLMVLDDGGWGPGEYRDRLAARIQTGLPELPRFRQRLSRASRWRRPRWLPAAELDWDWHVPAYDLADANGRPGGMSALHALVADLQGTVLPRDRPLWRFAVVTGFAPGKVAAILVIHHVVADGIGTITQALTLLEPEPALPAPPALPGPLLRAVGAVIGLAQLATDGHSRYRLPADTGPVRRFGTLAIPLPQIRAVAHRHGVRLTDVLLATVAGGLRQVLDARSAVPQLRTAVPEMMRTPGTSAEGNSSAATMIDLPLGPMPERARLAEIGRRSRRLRSGTRVLGARFVMRVGCAAMPLPLLFRFARTVYGRRFFQAIVSNMPGPVGAYQLAGARIGQVFPVVPLAPGAPLAVGALGWDGTLFVGVSLDPALVEDADRLTAGMRRVFDELAGAPAGDGTVAREATVVWCPAGSTVVEAATAGRDATDPPPTVRAAPPHRHAAPDTQG